MNTTQDTKHTPTPWKLPVGIIGPDKVWCEDSNGNETLVARGIENEHDAAFIVRACNEHAALCAAVAKLKEMISLSDETRPPFSEHQNRVNYCANESRAILANLAHLRNQA